MNWQMTAAGIVLGIPKNNKNLNKLKLAKEGKHCWTPSYYWTTFEFSLNHFHRIRWIHQIMTKSKSGMVARRYPSKLYFPTSSIVKRNFPSPPLGPFGIFSVVIDYLSRGCKDVNAFQLKICLFLLLNFGGHKSFSWGHWYPLFWTSGDICAGFQRPEWIPFACFLTCVILRFTFCVTPADCIEVSMAAGPFWSLYLQTCLQALVEVRGSNPRSPMPLAAITVLYATPTPASVEGMSSARSLDHFWRGFWSNGSFIHLTLILWPW